MLVVYRVMIYEQKLQIESLFTAEVCFFLFNVANILFFSVFLQHQYRYFWDKFVIRFATTLISIAFASSGLGKVSNY